MQPGHIVEAWIEAFNRADAEALAAFYTEDAINHQVAESPVHGREGIRAMFAAGFATAKMVCIPEKLFQDGEWPSSRGVIRLVFEAVASSMSLLEKLFSSAATGTSCPS